MKSSQPDSASRGELPTLSSMWLAGAKANDADAWNRLVNTFGPIVYRWCRVSGVSESESPDVVQDVFAAVARGMDRFQREKPEGSFRSWLATITRNKVRDHFRQLARRQEAVGGTDALVSLQQQAEALASTICPQSMQSPLVRLALEQVRAEFEPATWDAFWLTTIERKSAGEVSETVGISVASVYQSKSRILRRLRQELSQIPG
jgi:RNA polymerase sigma-70 factor (ECF subfamily)